jgi:hypothetical protein
MATPHPLATRRDLAATAATPARVPAASGNRAEPGIQDSMQLAVASLLAATKRTQGIGPTQLIDLQARS